jgi:soluble lytic murein transglycosylase
MAKRTLACFYLLYFLISAQAHGFNALIQRDSSGAGAIRTGNWAEALDAILTDTSYTDSSFRNFKLGFVHAEAQNDGKAIHYLRRAAETDTIWSAFAYEKIGDVELKNNRSENALKTYRAAMDCAQNQRYQQHIYSTIKNIVTANPHLAGSLPWLEEIIYEPPPKDSDSTPQIKDLLETLIQDGEWARVDSLVSDVLDSSISGSVHCEMAARLINEPVPDSVLTTKALFRLSRIASSCKNYKASSDWLLEAISRPDFASKINDKTYLYHRAQLNYRLKNYAKALKWLKKYEKKYGLSPEIIYMTARCHRSTGKDELAAIWYRMYIEKYPRASMSADITWYLAWALEDLGDHAGARRLYRKLFENYPKYSKAQDARFRYALSFVREDAMPQALAALDEAKAKTKSQEYSLAAWYWQAKCLARLGLIDKAKSEFKKLSASAPLDYYAFKAREFLAQNNDSAGFAVPVDSATSIIPADIWIDSVSSDKDFCMESSDSTKLRIGLLLAQTGMRQQADFILEPVAIRYNTSTPLHLCLSNAYAVSGDVTRSFSSARRMYWRIPSNSRTSMPLDIYKLLYPRGFREPVNQFAPEFGIDSCLAWAIIRQESLFDPEIVSPVGAIGLMQIMPYTGKEIADDLNTPFTTDSLYSAGFNVRFGCYYISKVLNQFGGCLACAIASYNGGPHNVKEWLEKESSDDADLFVEDIAFSETRTYVRKVLGNYWTYRWLARKQP